MYIYMYIYLYIKIDVLASIILFYSHFIRYTERLQFITLLISINQGLADT